MKRNTPLGVYITLAFLSLLLLLGTGAVCYGTLFGNKHTAYHTLCVPDLIGTAYDASSIPQPFFASVVYQNDEHAPAGTVLAQSPAPGTLRTVAQGTPVPLRLSVSMGKQTQRIPDTLGTDVRQAERLLRDLGLCTQLCAKTGTDAPSFAVLESYPEPDALVFPGTQVTLVYAAPQKNATATVPDLYGLSPTEANLRLLCAGLLPGQDASLGDSDLYVSWQSIAPGTKVFANTKIDYTLTRIQTPWNIPIADESSKESADFTR